MNVPLEPPDQQYWQAAVGYVELGMFQEANDQLENIDPFNRAAPEVLAVRLAIYRELKKWELLQQIAKRLKEFQPDNVEWTISLEAAMISQHEHRISNSHRGVHDCAIRALLVGDQLALECCGDELDQPRCALGE